jgi:hypothetical protein
LSSKALLISPRARQAVVEESVALPSTLNKTSVTVADDLLVTPSKSSPRPQIELSPDSKKLSEIMQMMQAMMHAPESAVGRALESSSGECGPDIPMIDPS